MATAPHETGELSVALRPMLETDVLNVLKVERAAYQFPWSEGIFRDCLRVGYCCWVLEFDSRIRGFGIMQVVAGEAHILNLCIDPSLHNRGLGRRLLEQLLQLAARHRANTTFLEVRPSNPAARRLYANAGFNEVGTRRGYYPAAHGREDAIIMARANPSRVESF
ncbi:MAG: ribosomal protein S18-alanine N-acetyltransferase [Gammaproteobacteria bacterium]|nr:ribosomal protein S18-alanine N-acetyltransferase [Gammaproteobacteria bacterium]